MSTRVNSLVDCPVSVVLVCTCILVCAPAVAQHCHPYWTTLGSIAEYEDIHALAIYDDDGEGPHAPMLYVAGSFEQIGGVAAHNIARWTGTCWEPVGEGTDNRVYDLLVFDKDGQGPGRPVLLAGGVFSYAGSAYATGLAAWDGTTWSPMDTYPSGWLLTRSLGSIDADGDGPLPPSLVVGTFEIGGAYVMVKEGPSWRTLGNAFDHDVITLASFDEDGAGPAPPTLYAGGAFTECGSSSLFYLARWDGTRWVRPGISIDPPPNSYGVEVLSVYDHALGHNQPALVVGGRFYTAGGLDARSLAKWDGTAWSVFEEWSHGSSLPSVRGLTAYDADGPGPGCSVLVVGSEKVYAWDGSDWSSLGDLTGCLHELFVSDSDGHSPHLPVLHGAGTFQLSGQDLRGVARWGCMLVPGDVNCDGLTNFGDINPFVLAMNGFQIYDAAYPDCDWLNADCNDDGLVNFGDINPFIRLLLE